MKTLLYFFGVVLCVSVACAQTGAAKSRRPARAETVANNAATASGTTVPPLKIQTDQQIRKGLVAETSLSTGAKNCQIAVRQGTVTLRGAVATKEERNTIVQMALRSVEESKIVDAMEVRPAVR